MSAILGDATGLSEDGKLDRTDRQLLATFLERRDHGSFAELVSRHRSLVMGTCRRILRNEADAEDAFQATFLVLARRAQSLRWQACLAGWLHETARRTALKLVQRQQRLARREWAAGVQRTQGGAPSSQPSTEDVAALVDEELARLPRQLRDPLALTLFEELSRQETALRLGLSLAQVKDRLERGREQLRRRLQARGVTVSAALVSTCLSVNAASAASSALVKTTVPAAVAFASGKSIAGLASGSVLSLAQGVLQMSFLTKLKLGLCAALPLLLLAGMTLAESPEQRFEKGLRGRIESVDLTQATPRITIKLDEFEVLLNLDVNKDAKVFIAYELCDLKRLVPGMSVGVRLADDHRTVREIQALGQTHDVHVLEVNAEKRVLVCAVRNDDNDNQEVTKLELPLDPDARIWLGQLPGTIGQLRPGSDVRLELDKDGKKVRVVEGEVADGFKITGELKAVDAATGLTISFEADDQARERQVKLARGAVILIDGKQAEPGALQPGMSVRARLAPDDTIEALSASTPNRDDP